MPTTHARLSPSAANIWMVCPGAIPLIERMGIKDRGGNIYADRGTAMHTVMERCLTDAIEPEDFIGKMVPVSESVAITIDADMAKMVRVAVGYVRGLDADMLLCEEKLTISDIFGVFGTADVAALRGDMLEVVDLKTGRTEVQAVRNRQLMLYMVGAWREFGETLGAKAFRITIIQPAVYDEPQSYDFDLEELRAFEHEFEAAAKRTTTDRGTFVPTESGCRWCRARHVCPAQVEMVNELARVEFKDVAKIDKNDDLARLYSLASTVKLTIKAIETEVASRLAEGAAVPGYRLAPSSTTRAWDESKIHDLERSLSRLLDEEVFMTEPKLKSPAQLEKALREAEVEFNFGDYLETKDPSPVVVREDSKKPLWSSNDQAKRDFAMHKNNPDE